MATELLPPTGSPVTSTAPPSSAATTTTDFPSSAATSFVASTHIAHRGAELSQHVKQVAIPTAILGFFVLALVLYSLYRWLQGTTVHEIICFRRHEPSEILLSPRPQNKGLTALPIHREIRYSVDSSRHPSHVHLARPPHEAPLLPPLKHLTLTTSDPTTCDNTRHAVTKSTTASETHLRKPERVLTGFDRGRSKVQTSSSKDTTKSDFRVGIRESNVDLANGERDIVSPDRWSWTNSQAPPTPRVYAPSLHSSISSLSRFLGVRSWVRSRPWRIDEECPPLPKPTIAKWPSLKNKASFPVLAPR
ncbi:hypothetical protein BAUCODRAFT_120958 [Baudoinia panamericana UAMH 10762]|uniref:Uncharacterized protein n=1 Tax=Baudoinia panamericana (strain UAMH 10762) TaxID=717646 RepID=M2MN02_BAUPA|nr:uncharacterized protein BAUCODRAFT_120958 [Baudoinia panamericana UAMH 10762]EMC98051.1 hypothetical protein BAUCODRAFT_120958 [Baudoinia panamericana UAMH 10762]